MLGISYGLRSQNRSEIMENITLISKSSLLLEQVLREVGED